MIKRTIALALAGILLLSNYPAVSEGAGSNRFRNPQGGKYAHRNPFCAAVDWKYLPLQEIGAESPELLERLKPCKLCGEPPAPSGEQKEFALLLDMPFDIGSEECKERMGRNASFKMEGEGKQSEEGYSSMSWIAPKTFTLLGKHPDSVGFGFMWDKLDSADAQFRLPDPRGKESNPDDRLHKLLALFFDLAIQMEKSYGAPTNGGIIAGTAYPHTYYDYPLAGHERDAAELVRILCESPDRSIMVFEVYGNVSLVISRGWVEVEALNGVTGVVSLLYANRDDLPEGSLSPFAWPGGRYEPLR